MDTYNELTDNWLNQTGYLLAEKEIMEYTLMQGILEEETGRERRKGNPLKPRLFIKVGKPCIIQRKTLPNNTINCSTPYAKPANQQGTTPDTGTSPL